MKSDVELRLPPDVQYVGLARLVVTVAARQAGMADERVEDLKIAVSEATTNAIRAHRQAEEPRPVVLSFGPTTDDTFGVTIVDTGPGFDPLPPDAHERREWTEESGLGVTLIRGLADDVEFVRGEGMRVNMRFAVGLTVNGQGHNGSD
ncbi:MAG TPA: ATP-binding protein [Egibacteraceae bacterium]|nr:ATP-binding protein [Egibacteraceae bacterium]